MRYETLKKCTNKIKVKDLLNCNQKHNKAINHDQSDNVRQILINLITCSRDKINHKKIIYTPEKTLSYV